ncbi:uncharacterized protein LOC128859312 [Anastrepha ludens]|uniref:uncharacterized protein LOC128859312 n=1 Tax=Anastrepha ludens TaxID=28586 RepID=UPI0023B14D2C|nr:uncharacterized protein LOC128859312 [Anastrepha ludens]
MLPPHTHVTTLLQLLIQKYFAQFSSVLIIHGGQTVGGSSTLQQEYLEAVQLAFRNLSQQGRVIGLQWIDVSQLDKNSNCNEGATSSDSPSSSNSNSNTLCDDSFSYDDELQLHLLRAVDIITEGFITILTDTVRFVHARYYATRNAELRLKDKFYLFLCEHENPQDLLSTEILQFYPHHLMVIPETQNKTKKSHESTVTNIPNTNATRARSKRYPSIQITPLYTHHDLNFQLWTQKFVGTNGNLDAMLLDEFLPNGTFSQNAELFPNKVSNMRGRTLRVGSITYIPYVVTNYVPDGTGEVDALNSSAFSRTVSFLGSEAELMKSFCDSRNCRLSVENYGGYNWGYIYENESSEGMMGGVYTQNVEVAIGCVYNWYNNITETSFTIARSAAAILGPAPAQFPAWRACIMPFSGQLWLFLIMAMVLCAIVMYFIQFTAFGLENWRWHQTRKFHHTTRLGQALLDMFAVFIQQPSGPTSLRTFAARLFLATILCATITLENTYSGQLKSLLTIPLFTEAMDTLRKWSTTDWTWGAPSIVWVQSIEGSDIVLEQIMTKKFEVQSYGFLYNASFRSDYGVGIERLMSGSFAFGDYITPPAMETKIVIKDDLFFDWTRAVSIRGWPLMPLFDKHIRACIETGLFVHWERESVAKYLDRQSQEILLDLASGNIKKLPPQNLTLENISGAVFALLFGCLIATKVFILELIIYHLNKLKLLDIYRKR